MERKFREKVGLGIAASIVVFGIAVGSRVSKERLDCNKKTDWKKGFSVCEGDGHFWVTSEKGSFYFFGKKNNIDRVGEYILVGFVNKTCFVSIIDGDKVISTTDKIEDADRASSTMGRKIGHIEKQDFFVEVELYDPDTGENTVQGTHMSGAYGGFYKTFCQRIAQTAQLENTSTP